MSEKPILFSGPMVRAILDGKKTQTRRVVKPQPVSQYQPIWAENTWGHEWRWRYNDPLHGVSAICEIDDKVQKHYCPYGKPGDRLWVRETWANVDDLKTF